MKRYLIIAIVVLNCLMLIQAALLRAERAERKRMQSNNEVLTDSVEFYRTASGKHAASRQVLELRASEMERYNAQLAAQVRELRIKVRRLEAAATTATLLCDSRKFSILARDMPPQASAATAYHAPPGASAVNATALSAK